MNYAFKAPRRHEIDAKLEQQIFFPAKLDQPRGGIHDTRGDMFLFIHPGEKTPCECFQAEKVAGRGGGSVWGRGNPGCYGKRHSAGKSMRLFPWETKGGFAPRTRSIPQ